MSTDISIDEYRTRLISSLQSCGVPRQMWDQIVHYVVSGRPVGDFLAAVMSNLLVQSVRRADIVNQQALPQYVQMLEGVLPATCWGTPQNVSEWQRRGGLVGMQISRQAAIES